MEEIGLVQIYTGDGKGKTTAAVGQAIRAIGHNFDVCLIYFHKNSEERKHGEFPILEELGVKVRGFAERHPHFDEAVSQKKIRKECLKGVEFIKETLEEGSFDLVILDEIIISMRDGFLKEKELLEILEIKPERVELILTGRGVSEKLIEKADLVSEIKKIKHPYEEGMESRRGIEF